MVEQWQRVSDSLLKLWGKILWGTIVVFVTQDRQIIQGWFNGVQQYAGFRVTTTPADKVAFFLGFPFTSERMQSCHVNRHVKEPSYSWEVAWYLQVLNGLLPFAAFIKPLNVHCDCRAEASLVSCKQAVTAWMWKAKHDVIITSIRHSIVILH